MVRSAPRRGPASSAALLCKAYPDEMGSIGRLGLAAIEDFRNVEPELPFVIDSGGLSLGVMAFQVETRAPPKIVILPFRLEAIPVKIAPTRDDEIKVVIFRFVLHD